MTLKKHLFIMLPCLLLLEACANNPWLPEASNMLKIESDPTGASIIIMGNDIGKTPLDIPLSKVYPVVYPAAKNSLYGIVELVKPDCESIPKHITSADTVKGLNIKLNCKTSDNIVSPVPIVTTIETKSIIGSPEKQVSSKDRSSANIEPETNVISDERTLQSKEKNSDTTTPKQRLLQLDILYKDNLITEKEYKIIRQRILDSL